MQNYDLSLLLAKKSDVASSIMPPMSPPRSLPSVHPFNQPSYMSSAVPEKHTSTTISPDAHVTATNQDDHVSDTPSTLMSSPTQTVLMPAPTPQSPASIIVDMSSSLLTDHETSVMHTPGVITCGCAGKSFPR